jgi:hypothetical protein
MKIGLLCLLSTFLISLNWEKQQRIESTWRVFDSSQDMLLYFPRQTIICIFHISLIILSTNWLSVVGPLHKRVIDSFIIPVAPIIKCTWHEVHLHNHFFWSYPIHNNPFGFIQYCQPTIRSSTTFYVFYHISHLFSKSVWY